MKNIKLILFFICTINLSFSQEIKNKHVEITGSFIYLKYLGNHIDYGLNVSTYKDSSKFSNEISLYVSNINAFKEFGVNIKQDYFTIGKAYIYSFQKFFFKSFINTGLYLTDFRGTGYGYQHEIGIAINPRIYTGFTFRKFKFGITTNFTFNYGWVSLINENGENENSGVWFPRGYNFSLNGYLSLTYSIK